MKDQLMRYIELLFADAPDAYELRHEILQDSLQKYDELCKQGMSQKEAYRITTDSIGDIEATLFSYRHTHGVLNEKPYKTRFKKALFVDWGLLVMCIGTLFLLLWESFGADLLALIAIATGAILYVIGTSIFYTTQVYITACGKRRNKIISIVCCIWLAIIYVPYLALTFMDIDVPTFFLFWACCIRPMVETIYTCLEIRKLAPTEQRSTLQKRQLYHAMIYGAFILVMTATAFCDRPESIIAQIAALVLYVLAGMGIILFHEPNELYCKDGKRHNDLPVLLIAFAAAIIGYILSNQLAFCGAAFLIVCAVVLLIRQYREIGKFNRYQRQSTTM